MRPQPQPRTGLEGDLVRRKNVPAVKVCELRMCRRERIGDAFVLGAQDAARGIDESPAGLHQPRCGVEDAALLFGELPHRLRPMAPLEVGVAPQRAEAGAWRIYE